MRIILWEQSSTTGLCPSALDLHDLQEINMCPQKNTRESEISYNLSNSEVQTNHLMPEPKCLKLFYELLSTKNFCCKIWASGNTSSMLQVGCALSNCCKIQCKFKHKIKNSFTIWQNASKQIRYSSACFFFVYLCILLYNPGFLF